MLIDSLAIYYLDIYLSIKTEPWLLRWYTLYDGGFWAAYLLYERMGMQPYIAFQMEIGVYKKLYTVQVERRRNSNRNRNGNSGRARESNLSCWNGPPGPQCVSAFETGKYMPLIWVKRITHFHSYFTDHETAHAEIAWRFMSHEQTTNRKQEIVLMR